MMQLLDSIRQGKKVYHILYGWGEVTSGEPGSDFQVKFPSLKEVKSFDFRGFEQGAVSRSIFETETHIIQKGSEKSICLTIKDDGIAFSAYDIEKPEFLQIADSLLRYAVVNELDEGKTEENIEEQLDDFIKSVKNSYKNKKEEK